MFYIIQLIVLMVAGPIIATVIDVAASGRSVAEAATTWFVLFAGVRLFTASISQMMKPSFTAQNILGGTTANPGANYVVQELGFANFAMGALGILAPWLRWTTPAALVIGLFFFIAAVRHLMKPGKNRREWFATLTDLAFGIVLLAIFVIGLLAR